MTDTLEMFKIFNRYRGNSIVLSGRGGRHWQSVSEQPDLDIALGDPAMGGHSSFALGLALSRPNEKVIQFDSEGDVLMGLGALPTIADKMPNNFYHFMLDNEVYGTTGGQPVPNAQNISYDVIAKGAGYPNTYAFDNIEDFASSIEEILSLEGPVFIALKIIPEVTNVPIGQRVKWQNRTRDQIISDFKNRIGVNN